MKIATRLRLGGFSFAGNLPLINMEDRKRTHGGLFRGLPCVFRLFVIVSLFAGHLLRLRLDDVLDVAPQRLGHLLQHIDISGDAGSLAPGFECPNRDAALSAEIGTGHSEFDAPLVDSGHVLSHGHSSHGLRLLCPLYYNACVWFRQCVNITIHTHCYLCMLAT